MKEVLMTMLFRKGFFSDHVSRELNMATHNCTTVCDLLLHIPLKGPDTTVLNKYEGAERGKIQGRKTSGIW
jgi:hypothetical protein